MRAAGDDEGGPTVLTGILRDPEQFELLVATGQRLIQQGKLDDARQLIETSIKLFAA